MVDQSPLFCKYYPHKKLVLLKEDDGSKNKAGKRTILLVQLLPNVPLKIFSFLVLQTYSKPSGVENCRKYNSLISLTFGFHHILNTFEQ